VRLVGFIVRQLH